MRFTVLAVAAAVCLHMGPAFAGDMALDDLKVLDLDEVDPELVADMFSPWTISNAEGDKDCMVVLKRGQTIGGMEIEVAPNCAALFPVMDDITAWRLMEGWAIDLVDAERKTRIRFETPDDIYVAYPETDGIFTIQPVPRD